MFRVDGRDGFADSDGEPVAGATARDGRATSLVGRQGETVAAIWHDPALNTDPELVNAASQATLLALENGRLETALDTATQELAASRAETVAAGEAAWRQVERDLHDGAQQQLIALQIMVELAREMAASDSEVAARLADVGQRLEDALVELRDLAHGGRPRRLGGAGLREALASVAQRSVPPAMLRVDGIARYPQDVEAAVYYCCVEALQNVGKHAGPGTHTEIRVGERANALWFEILVDGVGFEIEQSWGSGLTNMRERLAAVHGTLTVGSAVGRGTWVRGRIPLRGDPRSSPSAQAPRAMR